MSGIVSNRLLYLQGAPESLELNFAAGFKRVNFGQPIGPGGKAVWVDLPALLPSQLFAALPTHWFRPWIKLELFVKQYSKLLDS